MLKKYTNQVFGENKQTYKTICKVKLKTKYFWLIQLHYHMICIVTILKLLM